MCIRDRLRGLGVVGGSNFDIDRRPYNTSRTTVRVCDALRLCRTDLRILICLLTGHADLNRHLTLMQIRTDTVCPLCQEDE